MNANNQEIKENLEFLESRIFLYKDLIKIDADIKNAYQNSVMTCLKAIDRTLIEIIDLKKYGSKIQLQTKKQHIYWWKDQLKFEKKGVKWCNQNFKNYKIELAFYEKSYKQLINKKLAK